MFEVVLVLGPGRCGSSLVMRLLNLAGVALSADLVPANEANPAGHWEDRVAVEVHRGLLAGLGRDDLVGNAFPLPGDWMASPAAAAAKSRLLAHVAAAREAHAGPWGVKDPRLSLLLPLWREVCAELDVPVRYVYSLRHPASVANSIRRAYALDAAIGEALWLNRVAFALRDMPGEFCLVHYEDLMAEPARALRGMLAFLRGGAPVPDAEVERLIADGGALRRDLNRATRETAPSNPAAAALYAELRRRSGATRLDAALDTHVQAYLRSCREQAGWQRCIETERANVADLERRHANVRELMEQAVSQRERLRGKLRATLRQWREERARLRSELHEQRLKHESAMGRVRESRAYVLGQYFSDAKRSWLGLLRLPYRFWRLVLGPGRGEQALREKLEALRAERTTLLDSQRRLGSAANRRAADEAGLLSWTLKAMLSEVMRDRVHEDAFAEPAARAPLGERAAPGRPGRARVLYVGPVAFKEGIWETRAKYIFPDLFDEIADAAEIHMLTGAVPEFARDSLESLCRRYGIRHHEVARRRTLESTTDFWLSEAVRVAHEVRPDVVTNIFGAADIGYVIGVVARLFRARGVLRIAGDEIGVRKLLGVYDGAPERLEQDTLHQNLSFALVDRVLTMSPWEQQRVQSVVRDADKVRVCMRGIDLQKFAADGARADGRCRRFLYVGRKSIEKGYDVMERAAAFVARAQRDVEFIFAGNFPLRREGNCEYVGFVQAEDLPALYRQVDALILPSRSEGFPQSLGEAMAMGKPCLLPEEPFGRMFRHGEDALLFPLTPQALADAVLKLYADPALAQRLGAAALAIARERLDRRRWKGMYRSLLLDGA